MEQDELWVAQHDYKKERDDVLSFRKGDRFKVKSKTSVEWWAVKCVDTNDVGYVPATYLQVRIHSNPSSPHRRQCKITLLGKLELLDVNDWGVRFLLVCFSERTVFVCG